MNRLPPGQSETQKWPVLHEGSPLAFDPATWNLKIHGEVENPLQVTWDDFQAWPKSTYKSDFHCVTRWSLLNSEWTGTPFGEVIQRVRPRKSAAFVRFADHQGYDTSVPISVASREDSYLVTGRSGEPLSPEHGGPLRVFIPKLYAWKSCKWVVEIEFLAKDRLGYWEVRGYHNGADPWREERLG